MERVQTGCVSRNKGIRRRARFGDVSESETDS